MSCQDSFELIWEGLCCYKLQVQAIIHCSDLLGLSFQVSKPLINSQSFVVGGSFCDLVMGHGQSQVTDPRALPDGCAQDPAGLDEGTQCFFNNTKTDVLVIEDSWFPFEFDPSDPPICSRRFKRRRVLNNLLKEYHDLSLPVPNEVNQLALEVFDETLCDKMPKRKFESKMFQARSLLKGLKGWIFVLRLFEFFDSDSDQFVICK